MISRFRVAWHVLRRRPVIAYCHFDRGLYLPLDKHLLVVGNVIEVPAESSGAEAGISWPAEERHERFLRDHEERMRRVDEALKELRGAEREKR